MQSIDAGPAGSPVLVERFDSCLDRQLELCLALETLADSLPSRVDTYAAMILMERLTTTLRGCHDLEEAVVFPVLRGSCIDAEPVLTRLRTEHVEDEDHVADLRDAFEMFVGSPTGARAEQIGYMLRGLFTALRRHLAFDKEHVLPICRRACGL